MTYPRTTGQLRDRLDAAGLTPNKGRGQCFLTDAQAVDAVVRDAEVAAGDRIVEVGTGPGLLTHALVEAGAHVETFDIDEGLLAFTQAQRDWPESVRFHHADVLASKRELGAAFREALTRPGDGGKRRLVANLPYNIATPLLMGVLSLDDPPEAITVMIQNEVAEKMLAAPGDSTYGAPSLVVGLQATGRIVRRLPGKVFWPKPRVRSALLSLWPRRPRPLPEAEGLGFGVFVTALFTRRRKVLPTALAQAIPHWSAAQARAALDALGIAATLRPQHLTPEAARDLWSVAQQET